MKRRESNVYNVLLCSLPYFSPLLVSSGLPLFSSPLTRKFHVQLLFTVARVVCWCCLSNAFSMSCVKEIGSRRQCRRNWFLHMCRNFRWRRQCCGRLCNKQKSSLTYFMSRFEAFEIVSRVGGHVFLAGQQCWLDILLRETIGDKFGHDQLFSIGSVNSSKNRHKLHNDFLADFCCMSRLFA